MPVTAPRSVVARTLNLPLWQAITDGELAFPSIHLVEFAPDAPWYELVASLAIEAIRAGQPTDVHLFARPPSEAVGLLTRAGLDVPGLEASGMLRIIDSYTVQTGVMPAAPGDGETGFMSESVDLAKWGEAVAAHLAGESPERERGRFHLDGNIAVLGSYNSESAIVDFWRTRLLPLFRAREAVLVTGLAHGFASEGFYRQMELLADGILELANAEGETGLEPKLRVKSIRGRRVDTRWRPVQLSGSGEVKVPGRPSVPAGSTGPDIVSVLGRSGLESELRNFLGEQQEVVLSRFRVVGAYTRFEEPTRNLLKDFRLRLREALGRTPPKPENFLIWAPPGSGKTFFVHEQAAELAELAEFVELNLAATGEEEFRTALDGATLPRRPLMVFVDEVDSKPTEPWPYEALLPALEPPAPRSVPVVFVLAGSSGGALPGLKDALRARPKGPDLLSRVPPSNELSIPALTRADRILVALSTLLEEAKRQEKTMHEVEKLALFYIALNPKLGSARTLREFVLRGVDAAPVGEDRLKFDYFFPAGDAESKEFWMGVRTAAPELVGSFLRVRA